MISVDDIYNAIDKINKSTIESAYYFVYGSQLNKIFDTDIYLDEKLYKCTKDLIPVN